MAFVTAFSAILADPIGPASLAREIVKGRFRFFVVDQSHTLERLVAVELHFAQSGQCASCRNVEL